MGHSPRTRTSKKPIDRYHHGDLPRALLNEALRTIQSEGVEHLTLRAVGERLGVSRSALYRHFADKQALLAAVAREGFRTLREALIEAWDQNGRGGTGFDGMGRAYVQFAIAHSSHYRVMFGRFLESAVKDAELMREAAGAFQALVDALVSQQQSGAIRRDDPVLMARLVWALVHGVAMLAIDGQLGDPQKEGVTLGHYAVERIRAAIES